MSNKQGSKTHEFHTNEIFFQTAVCILVLSSLSSSFSFSFSFFQPTVFVMNCLVLMCVKCRSLEYASNVFDRMGQRDTVSWNTMIFGYAGCEKMGIAQSFFDRMPQRDVVSWNSLISGYLQNGDYPESIDIFVGRPYS
jgi:pentatricopeptide repeat protein